MIGAILGMILDALKRIGNNTDAAGTNTLFAYLARGGVKNVQRGTVSVASSGTTTVTITAVNMAKSFVNFPNNLSNSAQSFEVTAVLTNSTTLTFTSNSSLAKTYSWEVVEYY